MSTTSILEHRIAPKHRSRGEGRSFDDVGEPFALSYRSFFPQLSCGSFSYVLWRSSRASWANFPGARTAAATGSATQVTTSTRRLAAILFRFRLSSVSAGPRLSSGYGTRGASRMSLRPNGSARTMATVSPLSTTGHRCGIHSHLHTLDVRPAVLTQDAGYCPVSRHSTTCRPHDGEERRAVRQ